MRIGWLGLGKLGMPIAKEVATTHTVYGNDIFMDSDLEPFNHYGGGLWYAGKSYLLDCDLVFVAVQTPHQPEYEGVTRLTETRLDFDYSHLTKAICDLAGAGSKRPPLVVISTVLPGTIERDVVPLWDGPVLYNPFFIAMGTEVADFLDPEFVLIGTHDSEWQPENDGVHLLGEFYRSLGLFVHRPGRKRFAPILVRTYREAELAKMAYNTYIGLKIAYANTIGEMSHRLGIDADRVMDVVKAGRRRIISDAYLDPGMGDGGPCHPRDNIALSWLARETGMSFDLFSAVMEQREAHADWLASRVLAEAGYNIPVTVLGRAYKPGTVIETGSSAHLVAALLRERGVEFDHVEDLP